MSFNRKPVLALIPVKKSSSRFPGKNLKKINGSTLLELTILQAHKSIFIDKIYVSSNSKKIISIASNLECITIKRPEILCTSNSNINKVVRHFLSKLPNLLIKKNPYIIYLQVTSPLRTFKHINKSFQILKKDKKHKLISFKKINSSILKSVIIKGKKISPINKESFLTSNSQYLPDLYSPNGAIFIFRAKDFFKYKKISVLNAIPYVMNCNESVDIDTLSDFKKVKKIME